MRLGRIGALLLLSAAFCLAGSFIYGLYDPFYRNLDKDYISRNCKSLPKNIDVPQHIVPDGNFWGTVYIFESVPGNDSKGDFEVAARSNLSELSCLPRLGCLVAPYLSERCQKGQS